MLHKKKESEIVMESRILYLPTQIYLKGKNFGGYTYPPISTQCSGILADREKKQI